MTQPKGVTARPSRLVAGPSLSKAGIARAYKTLQLDDETRKKLLEWSGSSSPSRPNVDVVETGHTRSLIEGSDDAELDGDPR